jgi:hypothetical protein
MPGHEAGRRPRKRYSVSPHTLAGKIIVGIHVGVDGVAFADIFAGHRPFRAFIADVIHMADRSAARGVEFLSGQFVSLFVLANFFAHKIIPLLVRWAETILSPRREVDAKGRTMNNSRPVIIAIVEQVDSWKLNASVGSS